VAHKVKEASRNRSDTHFQSIDWTRDCFCAYRRQS